MAGFVVVAGAGYLLVHQSWAVLFAFVGAWVGGQIGYALNSKLQEAPLPDVDSTLSEPEGPPGS